MTDWISVSYKPFRYNFPSRNPPRSLYTLIYITRHHAIEISILLFNHNSINLSLPENRGLELPIRHHLKVRKKGNLDGQKVDQLAVLSFPNYVLYHHHQDSSVTKTKPPKWDANQDPKNHTSTSPLPSNKSISPVPFQPSK